ncbi:hypothetical protein KY092_08310 [Natronomonas gomsonensis]|uniref:hypothetical protein n=1 Tax=Natronomonas gomsonensis TaxID=1046043 RepID=UPI0020CA6D98|nr:hypothetical protein [Natronomonas gomsonensis]MCY4730561.1 hypothetical protein [Natronomonas gomsonensis]
MLEFYREKGYWPTAKEMDIYVRIEKEYGPAIYNGGNYLKPRYSELLPRSDKGPDLVEYEEKREQKYCKKAVHGDVDDIPEDKFDDMDGNKMPQAHSVKPLEENAEQEVEELGSDDEENESDDSVIVPEEELEGSDEVEEEEDEEEDQELDTGDVIFGGEDDVDEEESTSHDDEEDSGEEDGGQDSISIDGTEYTEKEDGLWVSEDGEDYVFPPGKDEDDYDLDEYGDDSEPDKTAGQDGSEEKEQKEASLNQY